MTKQLCIILVQLCLAIVCASHNERNIINSVNDPVLNDRPIIGILAQEISVHLSKHFEDANSFVAASYVKFVEGGGARVVPVW